MSEKELTSFQEQLYKNLLTSALDAREEGKNSKPIGEPLPCSRYDILDTRPQEDPKVSKCTAPNGDVIWKEKNDVEKLNNPCSGKLDNLAAQVGY